MKMEVFLGIQTLETKRAVLERGIDPSKLKFHKENGLYILNERIEKCNSYVENFSIWLFAQLASNARTAVDTGGTSRTIAGGDVSTTLRLSMVPYTTGITTGGILVGTGTNATTISSFAMQTLIAHGTGGGQLSYGEITFVGWTTSGANSWYEISRTLTNSSGGNITVNEVGAVARMNATTTQHFLFERTILGTPETINNGVAKTFIYKFMVTV